MVSRRKLTRDEKVENLVTNFSMIMMGMFEGAFAAMASGLASALTRTAEALTESFGREGEHATPAPAPPEPEAEVSAKVREVFTSLRKEIEEGFSNRG